MIIRTYTDTKTLSYAPGVKMSTGIDRNGYITEISLKLACTYSTGAAVEPAEDGLANLISSVRINTAGRDFYNINNGKQALFLARCQYQDSIRNDDLSTTASQSGLSAFLSIPIHLGMRFYDPADKSIVIPAVELPSLNIEITWGNDASLGTGYTITSASLSWTITEILLQVGETKANIFRGGIPVPRMTPITEYITSAKDNLSQETDVPVGDLLSWILVIVVGATTGKRCNNFATEIGIKFPKEASIPYRENFQQATINTRRRWALTHDYKGVVFLPLSLISGNELGYNLAGYQVGDCKLAFTTSLSDTTEDTAQTNGGIIYQLFYNVGL